jgi:hypothetical protein
MSLLKKLVENWKKRSVTKKLSIKGTNDWKVYFKSNLTRWERQNDITNARSSSAKENWDFLVVFFASLFSRALFWSSISLRSLLSFSYIVSAAALTFLKEIERWFLSGWRLSTTYYTESGRHPHSWGTREINYPFRGVGEKGAKRPSSEEK